MKNLLTALLILFPAVTYAQGWDWVKRPYTPAIEAYLCATDKFGHVYGGGGDLVTQYDTAGTFQWIKSIGSFPIALTTDNSGNLYVLGAYTSSNITVGSYTLTNTNAPYYQFFITKFNLTGGIVLASNIGNVVSMGSLGMFSGFGYYTGIKTDNQGNIYVTCPFSNNPTLGTFSFTNHDSKDSTNDILVAKMDSFGTVLWAKSYGGKKNDVPIGIAVTGSNYIYLDGNFSSDTIRFGTTDLVDTSTYIYGSNIFLAKLDNTGIPIWATKEGGTSNSVGLAGLVVDDNDQSYIVGSFGRFGVGSVTFGTTTFTSSGYYATNGFLVKYDSSGNVVWAKESRSCVATSIDKDLCNNIWINGGMVLGTDTIDGHLLNSPFHSIEPMFIAGWSSTGSFITASALNAGGDDQSQIAFDCAGDLFVCGDYNNDTFYVGHDTLFGGTGGGEEYMFIAKYNTGGNCNRCGEVLDVIVNLVESPILTVFPNPATTSLSILSSNRITSIAIASLIGQIIYSNNYNSEQVQVDVSGLPAGLYFIRINGTEVRKFVKQ